MKAKRTKFPKQADPPKQAPKSWRDVLPIHPACASIPAISEPELKELAADIARNGLQSAITIDKPPNGKLSLLDGRSRLDAIELAGIPFQLVAAGRNGLTLKVERPGFPPLSFAHPKDPRAFVLSANVHRRHLTAEQKRDAIENRIKADPTKSDRQIAEAVKASPTTVGTLRAKMEARGDVSKLDTRQDKRGRKQPARKKPKPAKEPTPHIAGSEAPAASAEAMKAKHAALDPPAVDEDALEERWQRSIANLADNAIAMRALWSREFPGWEKFEAPSHIAALIRQAADAWRDLARSIENRTAAIAAADRAEARATAR